MDYKIEQLQMLTDEELEELIKEYNYSKMSELTVPTQKRFREKINAEIARRKALSAEYKTEKWDLIVGIAEVEEKIELLEKVIGDRPDDFPLAVQQLSDLKKQLADLNSTYELIKDEKKANNEMINQLTDASKKTKFSIAKRRLNVGKKAVFVTAPQKICDLGKGLLSKIKNNVQKLGEKSLELSKKTEQKFDEYYQKNDESLAAIDNAMENLMQDFQQTGQMQGYEKYVSQNRINKELEKQRNKYEKVTKKGYIVSKLQPGIVRMIKLPATIIEKLSNRQPVVQEHTQSAMAM